MRDNIPSSSSKSLIDTSSYYAFQQRPSRRNMWIVVGLLSGLLVLCSVVAVLAIGRTVLSIATEETAITPILDRFMHAMSQGDIQTAYNLFSHRAQRDTSSAELSKLRTGPNAALFNGYESIHIDSTTLNNSVKIDSQGLQGSVAIVSGTIIYYGGVKGAFSATLEKEAGVWRIFAVNVSVPPAKIQPNP